MAVFFFLVGLEIKREMLAGELASARRAALPIAGALGGMVVPALLYAWLNAGSAGAPGWGIPMATDIAFALGVLALLGDRVPVGARVFLAALAIVDDIGAVLVIAHFLLGRHRLGRARPRAAPCCCSRSAPISQASAVRAPTARSASRSGSRCSRPASMRRSPACCSR